MEGPNWRGVPALPNVFTAPRTVESVTLYMERVLSDIALGRIHHFDHSPTRLAERLNVSRSTVYRAIDGLCPSSRARWKQLRWDDQGRAEAFSFYCPHAASEVGMRSGQLELPATRPVHPYSSALTWVDWVLTMHERDVATVHPPVGLETAVSREWWPRNTAPWEVQEWVETADAYVLVGARGLCHVYPADEWQAWEVAKLYHLVVWSDRALAQRERVHNAATECELVVEILRVRHGDVWQVGELCRELQNHTETLNASVVLGQRPAGEAYLARLLDMEDGGGCVTAEQREIAERLRLAREVFTPGEDTDTEPRSITKWREGDCECHHPLTCPWCSSDDYRYDE